MRDYGSDWYRTGWGDALNVYNGDGDRVTPDDWYEAFHRRTDLDASEAHDAALAWSAGWNACADESDAREVRRARE